MRLIKVFSLIALAAVAATALIGIGSASASVKKVVLCKVNQTLCKAENLWAVDAKGHLTIVALSSNAVLLASGLPVECHSEVTILAEKFTSAHITGKITALNWSNCKGCTSVATTVLPTGLLAHTSGGNGLLTTTSNTQVLLKGCTVFKVNCLAEAATADLTFLGGTLGSTAQTHAHEVPVTIKNHGGIGCPSSGKWDAQDGLGTSKSYIIKSINGITTGSVWISLESHA